MSGPIVLIFTIILVPLGVLFWNRQRTKGKIWALICRKDKSLDLKLCRLWNDFVIYGDRAYDVYPDLVRIARFPPGWPALFQELVPTGLYDEEDAIPLDWIRIGDRKVRAMELRAALDENWVRKLVHEAASEGGAQLPNFKKFLPIALIAVGAVGLAVMIFLR